MVVVARIKHASLLRNTLTIYISLNTGKEKLVQPDVGGGTATDNHRTSHL